MYMYMYNGDAPLYPVLNYWEAELGISYLGCWMFGELDINKSHLEVA